MKKKIVIVTMVAILVLGISTIAIGAQSFNNIPFPSLNTVSNTEYPSIVAKVGNITITGDTLTKQVEVEKYTWENLQSPQDNTFYEKIALGKLIQNALLDQEASSKGIVVTQDEAVSFLSNQLASLQSLPDTNPYKMQFIDYLKTLGVNSISDYEKLPQAIAVTQNVLARGKLRASFDKSTDWNAHIKQIVSDKTHYQLFVPVDVTGFNDDLNTRLHNIPKSKIPTILVPVKK